MRSGKLGETRTFGCSNASNCRPLSIHKQRTAFPFVASVSRNAGNVPSVPSLRERVTAGDEGETAGEILSRAKDLQRVGLMRLAGAPGGTRTPNLQLRRLALYPIELRARTSAYSLSRGSHDVAVERGSRGRLSPRGYGSRHPDSRERLSPRAPGLFRHHLESPGGPFRGRVGSHPDIESAGGHHPVQVGIVGPQVACLHRELHLPAFPGLQGYALEAF